MLYPSLSTIMAILALILSNNSFAQQSDKIIFDTYVLKKVQDKITAGGGITDAEMLYKELSSSKALQDWMHLHSQPSRKLVDATVAKKRNGQKFIAPGDIYEKTKHIFFDQEFFNSVPAPDMSPETVSMSYHETNAGFLADKKMLRQQVKETLEEQGTAGLFLSGILPTDDDGFTQKMLLTRSSKDGSMVSTIEEAHRRAVAGKSTEIVSTKLLPRPLRDKAMLLEKKYWFTDDEVSYIQSALEEEARFFEETIVAWSPKANYYATTEEEQQSAAARESLPYTISRALLLRMCQEYVAAAEYALWLEKMKGLANLSAETAVVFSTVNWEAPEAKRGDLSNPVIQMAQRSYGIDLRLEKLFFEAALLESRSKLIYRSYENIFGG